MGSKENTRFSSLNLFENILNENEQEAISYYSKRFLINHIINSNNPEYDLAIDYFRNQLKSLRLDVSQNEIRRYPTNKELITDIKKSENGNWIEVKYFNVFPSVPDAILNFLAIALTVGGLVTAPITGGTSILISCIAMGFAFFNNSKKEDDPIRLKIYKAIGELSRITSQNIINENYIKSALNKKELADLLNMNLEDFELVLPRLLAEFVLTQEDNIPDQYRSPSAYSQSQPAEEIEFMHKVQNACENKWIRLNKNSWIYPNIEDIAKYANLDTEIVKQGLDVLIEKSIVMIKKKSEKIGYWYTI